LICFFFVFFDFCLLCTQTAKRELKTLLGTASAAYDGIKLRELLAEAEASGLQNLEEYKSRLGVWNEIHGTIDEGVAQMDAVKLKQAITWCTRLGNPAALQPKLAEAFVAIQKMGTNLGSEVTKAIERMPSRESVRTRI
jgi:hypothetical protein